MSANKGKFGLLIVLALIMAGVSILLINLAIKSEAAKAARRAQQAAQEEYQRKLAEQGERAPAEGVEVLTAAQDILPGTRILPEMLRGEVVPETVLPEGTLKDREELGERIAVHFIPRNDVLTESKIRKENEVARASYLVEKGKRYITMPLDPAVQGVAAMIRIGDLIDIIATYGEGEMAVSKIIIQKAKVVDVIYGDRGTTINAAAPADEAKPRLGIGDTVTFEVAPEEAEILKALENSGMEYKYLLRNYQDDAIVQTAGKRTADVLSNLFGIEQAKPVEAPSAPPPPAPNVF